MSQAEKIIQHPANRDGKTRYIEATDTLRSLNDLLVGIDKGTAPIFGETVKVVVYFAKWCVANSKEANQLPNYSLHAPLATDANPYLQPIKFVFAGAGAGDARLKSKRSYWATIAEHVAKHNIAEKDFLEVFKRNGGADGWYRAIANQKKKLEQPVSPKAANRNDANPDVKENGHTEYKSDNSGEMPNSQNPKPFNVEREFVVAVYEITQSAHFSDANSLEKKLRHIDGFQRAIDVDDATMKELDGLM